MGTYPEVKQWELTLKSKDWNLPGSQQWALTLKSNSNFKHDYDDVSIVHASGTGQLQANPPIAGLRLSPGKSTLWVVNVMGYNDLVMGEDHMV